MHVFVRRGSKENINYAYVFFPCYEEEPQFPLQASGRQYCLASQPLFLQTQRHFIKLK